MKFDISLILKIIGWLFIGVPLSAFFVFCIYMLIGLSKDDEAVSGLIKVGFIVFLIGLALLVLIYLTNTFSKFA